MSKSIQWHKHKDGVWHRHHKANHTCDTTDFYDTSLGEPLNGRIVLLGTERGVEPPLSFSAQE